MAIPYGIILPLGVSHGLVTVLETLVKTQTVRPNLG
jgi:hypothetical protein